MTPLGTSQQEVSLEEEDGAVNIRDQGPVGSHVKLLNDALFRFLDTDKDGKLSRAELAAAATAPRATSTTMKC